MTLTLRLALAAAVSWAASAACVTPYAGSGEGGPAGGTIVERWSHGGLCPWGSCQGGVAVGDDGRWWRTGGRDSLSSGTAPRGVATRLAAALEERWSALTSRPFSAACPTVYDGQETVWTVRQVAGGPAGDSPDTIIARELASCTWDLEHDEAAAALEEIRSLWAELGLPSPR